MGLNTVITRMAQKVGVYADTLKSAFLRVSSSIDSKPLFFMGGFLLFGWGLYDFLPWLSKVICGFILMAIGYLMGSKR
jgi:hypothetical protein